MGNGLTALIQASATPLSQCRATCRRAYYRGRDTRALPFRGAFVATEVLEVGYGGRKKKTAHADRVVYVAAL